MAPVEMEYYEALEVSHTSSDAEMKKSYRRLCLIHHPDKGGDPTRFHLIQEAWETLSDPEKRSEYDEFGKEGPGRGGMGGAGFDPEDIFASMFGGGGMPGGSRGGGGRGRPPPPTQAKPSVVQMGMKLEDLYNGSEKSIAVERSRKCGTCAGKGAKANAKPRPCNKCQGQGHVFMLRNAGPFMTRVPVECPQCDGEGQKYRDQDKCKKCNGNKVSKEKKKVTFTVDRGTIPGERIILKGEGDESPESSSPGDLHIIVSALPHPSYQILPSPYSSSPSDLATTLTINLTESLLGFSRLILTHLDGRGLRVTQPGPGEKGWRTFQTGDMVLIRGEGMWKRGSNGDLVVKIEVEQPDEAWAIKLKEEGGVEGLAKLLQEKRPDVENPKETDEVELEKFDESTKTGPSGHGHAHESDEYDEEDEDDGRPGCAQQ